MKYTNLISSPAQPAAYKIFFKLFRVSSTVGAIKEGVNCQFMHTKLIDITTIGERVFFCKIVVFKNVFRKHYQPVLWGFCEWENGTFYNFFFFLNHVNWRSLQREVE